MKEEEIIKITTALRLGKFQIILQDPTNPKKNRVLTYNGCTGKTLNEKPKIYLVEK